MLRNISHLYVIGIRYKRNALTPLVTSHIQSIYIVPWNRNYLPSFKSDSCDAYHFSLLHWKSLLFSLKKKKISTFIRWLKQDAIMPHGSFNSFKRDNIPSSIELRARSARKIFDFQIFDLRFSDFRLSIFLILRFCDKINLMEKHQNLTHVYDFQRCLWVIINTNLMIYHNCTTM